MHAKNHEEKINLALLILEHLKTKKLKEGFWKQYYKNLEVESPTEISDKIINILKSAAQRSLSSKPLNPNYCTEI